ncbi:MAG: hypothetical protein WC150_00310 [Bacteroidia bacterium]
MKKIILFGLLILCHPRINAQASKSNVSNGIKVLTTSDSLMEFKLKDVAELSFENLGEDGILLILKKTAQFKSQSGNILEFTKISRSFKIEYTIELPVFKKDYQILYKARDKEYIYYLMAPPQKRSLHYKAQNQNFVPGGYMIKEYDILKYNYLKKTYELYSGRLSKKFSVSHFWASGGHAYFGGRNIKTKGRVCWEMCFFTSCFTAPLMIGVGNDMYRNPLFISANIEDKVSKVAKWSGSKSRKVLISEICIPDSSNTATVIVLDKRYGKYRTYIMNTNGQGYGQASPLDFPENMQAHHIKVHSVNGEVKYITGLYGKKGKAQTLGMFYVKLSGLVITDFKQIPYSKFSNLKGLLSEDDRKNLGDKDMHAEIAIYAHNIIEREDDNLIFAEFAYPEYTMVAGERYVNGNWQSTYNRVFTGYIYTKFLAISFDKNGDLRWDRSIDISKVPKQKKLSEQVKMINSNDSGYNFIYSLGTEKEAIDFRSFSFDKEVFSNEKTISSKRPNFGLVDMKLKQKNETLMHWYGDYYLSFGSLVHEDVKDSKKQSTQYFIMKMQVIDKK